MMDTPNDVSSVKGSAGIKTAGKHNLKGTINVPFSIMLKLKLDSNPITMRLKYE